MSLPCEAPWMTVRGIVGQPGSRAARIYCGTVRGGVSLWKSLVGISLKMFLADPGGDRAPLNTVFGRSGQNQPNIGLGLELFPEAGLGIGRRRGF